MSVTTFAHFRQTGSSNISLSIRQLVGTCKAVFYCFRTW